MKWGGHVYGAVQRTNDQKLFDQNMIHFLAYD